MIFVFRLQSKYSLLKKYFSLIAQFFILIQKKEQTKAYHAYKINEKYRFITTKRFFNKQLIINGLKLFKVITSLPLASEKKI